MQTQLTESYRQTEAGLRAETLLRACVHCGFCNATCPTYRLTGNELDGPRGRIYLMKQVFEGAPASAVTRQHLDRCLGCRGCETTCPSGVGYSELLDLGRAAVAAVAPRPWPQRVVRATLRGFLVSAAFAPLYRVAQRVRPVLPKRLRSLVQPRESVPLCVVQPRLRQVIVPRGCVQPTLLGGVDVALMRLLDRLAIEARVVDAGCCGAVAHHTEDPDGSLRAARRNIDAWWPLVEAGAEAILWTASACTLEVREYGSRLVADPQYAVRAARISALARDPGEYLLGERAALLALRASVAPLRVAFHPPCTLQHGLKAVAAVQELLRAFGAELQPVADAHLCCGSAGTYSVLQPAFSQRLRREKIAHLTASAPAVVLSANVGCILHLRPDAPVPVRHWLEWLVERVIP